MSAAGDPADRRIVEAFADALRAAGYSVTALVWYGSRVHDARDAASDWDLIVVALEFAGVRWVERLVGVYGHWPVAHAADILCYTPAEFARLARRATIVREAVRTGCFLRT